MAGKSQIERSSEAISANRRDNRNRRALDFVHQRLPQSGEVPRFHCCEGIDFVDIRSSGESLRRSGDDDALNRRRCFDPRLEYRIQLLVEFREQRSSEPGKAIHVFKLEELDVAESNGAESRVHR